MLMILLLSCTVAALGAVLCSSFALAGRVVRLQDARDARERAEREYESCDPETLARMFSERRKRIEWRLEQYRASFVIKEVSSDAKRANWQGICGCEKELAALAKEEARASSLGGCVDPAGLGQDVS
jgi:hypothetical protein